MINVENVKETSKLKKFGKIGLGIGVGLLGAVALKTILVDGEDEELLGDEEVYTEADYGDTEDEE